MQATELREAISFRWAIPVVCVTMWEGGEG